jgi:DNA-binding protein WhiA
MSSVSFSRRVREELLRHGEARPCCRMAEVAALVRTTGTFHIRGGASEEAERYALHLSTTSRAAAHEIYSYFKGYGAVGDLLTRREPRFRRRLLYEIHLPGSPPMLQALNELGILTDSFKLEPGLPSRILRGRCCRSAFVRGCMVGSGSVSPPSRSSHLEILSPYEAFALDLARLLAREGFSPGVYQRRGSHVVYLKSGEEVAALLAFMGAQEAALEFEEQAVVKDVRARANRVANCDEANTRRTSAAALRQARAVTFLEEEGLMDDLPEALREAAELRTEHPYLSLSELAAEAPGELSRSALNHRLRRLVAFAEEHGADVGRV